MRWSRGRDRFAAWVAVGVPLGAWCFAVACGTSTGAAAGAECFTALDCAAGLVCIPKGSGRVCEGASAISSIETMIDGGVEAAGDDDAGPLPSLDGTQPPETGPATDAVTTGPGDAITTGGDAAMTTPGDAAPSG